MGEAERAEYCKEFRSLLTKHFREKYLTEDMLISCSTQTAQAKAIEAGVFTEEEKPKALAQLVKLIERDGNHFKIGVIGARALFRVLAENGYAQLAYKLITQKDFPSYRYWIDHSATSLWEGFHEVREDSLLRKDGGRMLSLNHHFWGDISAWFYRYILGLRINPDGNDVFAVEIYSCEIPEISYAEGKYENQNGSISVKWRRSDDGSLSIQVLATGKYHYTIKKKL